jgi:hypothetical protein
MENPWFMTYFVGFGGIVEVKMARSFLIDKLWKIPGT